MSLEGRVLRNWKKGKVKSEEYLEKERIQKIV